MMKTFSMSLLSSSQKDGQKKARKKEISCQFFLLLDLELVLVKILHWWTQKSYLSSFFKDTKTFKNSKSQKIEVFSTLLRITSTKPTSNSPRFSDLSSQIINSYENIRPKRFIYFNFDFIIQQQMPPKLLLDKNQRQKLENFPLNTLKSLLDSRIIEIKDMKTLDFPAHKTDVFLFLQKQRQIQ